MAPLKFVSEDHDHLIKLILIGDSGKLLLCHTYIEMLTKFFIFFKNSVVLKFSRVSVLVLVLVPVPEIKINSKFKPTLSKEGQSG